MILKKNYLALVSKRINILIKHVKNIFPIVPPGGAVDPHKYGFNPISLEKGMD